jgi:cobalt-zinc-cadmium resistance protein CzcA
MFFGVLIITLVYVPILALTGIEGKMFRPMAVAVMFALVGALVLALTLMPALCSWFLRGNISERKAGSCAPRRRSTRPCWPGRLRLRWLVVAVALVLFAGSGWLFTKLGAEFIPQLDEGAMSIQMIRGNSVALGDSVELQRAFRETAHGEVSRGESCFLPHRHGGDRDRSDGAKCLDTYVFFAPLEKWREVDGRKITKAELAELMRRELVAAAPGADVSLHAADSDAVQRNHGRRARRPVVERSTATTTPNWNASPPPRATCLRSVSRVAAT